jgi:ATP-binding cassette subfamily B protein
VVPQEITLFHRTVRENIRFARPEATDEEVVEAARAANSDGFIRALPQGYDTLVGERGAKLSGGQRQRIGIARAFLKDAPIIVFDEATSALDTESEMAIQRALVRLQRDRTVIAVAHRLSTLTAFDRILVMLNGRVVEDGTVAELRRQGGPVRAHVAASGRRSFPRRGVGRRRLTTSGRRGSRRTGGNAWSIGSSSPC